MGITPEQFTEMDRRNEANKAKPFRPGEPKEQRVAEMIIAPPIPTGKRVRQSDKPLMNKLESEWFAILNAQFPNFPRPRAQAKTYLLARGCRYTPDVTCSSWPDLDDLGNTIGPAKETAFEVKGKKMWDDAVVKIKVAASVWTEVNWWLCWKEGGAWRRQRILPTAGDFSMTKKHTFINWKNLAIQLAAEAQVVLDNAHWEVKFGSGDLNRTIKIVNQLVSEAGK